MDSSSKVSTPPKKGYPKKVFANFPDSYHSSSFSLSDADIMGNFWVMSSKKIKRKPPMELTDGKFVTIKKTGQYLIYSQVRLLKVRSLEMIKTMLITNLPWANAA